MPLTGRRVLLIEDEPILLLDLQAMVDDLGGQPVPCPGGVPEALRLARETAVDVAVLDINLGGERSDPVADVLAARGIPFIFASGYADGLPAQHANRPVLQKPYDGERLRRALLACLGLSDPATES